MSGSRKFLLRLLQAGMELSWLYPIIACISLASTGKSLPLWAAVTPFITGALCARYSFGRGLRNYVVLILQVCGFAFVAAAIFWFARQFLHPVGTLLWIDNILTGHAGGREWAEFVLVCVSIVSFWLSGLFTARRQMRYFSICSRFDIGISVFFCSFLADMVIVYKGGNPLAGLTIFPAISFLLLGLLAISLSRVGVGGSRSFLPGHGAAGIIMIFAVTVLATVGAIVSFLLPILRDTARISYSALQTGGRFVEPWLVGITRFLFGPRNMLPDPPGAAAKLSDASPYLPSTTWFGRLFESVLEWGMIALFVSILLLGIAVILVILIRWLLLRTGYRQVHPSRPHDSSWFARLMALVARLFRTIVGFFRPPENGRGLYRQLSLWGRRSGIARQQTDTPLEYAGRLCNGFPLFKDAILFIVTLYSREVYRGETSQEQHFSSAAAHMSHLKSPRFWVRRMRRRWNFTTP
jgi:hypothetical protein